MVNKTSKYVSAGKVSKTELPNERKARWRSWRQLNRLTKPVAGEYAASPETSSKNLQNGDKPHNLKFENFEFTDIPEYANIEAIEVGYRYMLQKKGEKTPEMDSNTVNLLHAGKEIDNASETIEVLSNKWYHLSRKITLPKSHEINSSNLDELKSILKFGSIKNNAQAQFLLSSFKIKVHYTIENPVFTAKILNDDVGVNNHADFTVLLQMNEGAKHKGYAGRLKLPTGVSFVNSSGDGVIVQDGDYLLWRSPQKSNTVISSHKLTLHSDISKNEVSFERELLYIDSKGNITVLSKLNPLNLNISDSEIVINLFDNKTDYYLPENVELKYNDDLSIKLTADWNNTVSEESRDIIIGFERDKYNPKNLIFEDLNGVISLYSEDKLIDGVVWTEYHWNVDNTLTNNVLWIDSALLNDTEDSVDFKMHVHCVDEIERFINISQAPKPINAPIPVSDEDIIHYTPSDPIYSSKHASDDSDTSISNVKYPLASVDPYHTAIVLDKNELSRMGDNILYQFVVPYLCEDKTGKYGAAYPEHVPLPDTGRNHRIGVYCDNPFSMFVDESGHKIMKYWNNFGFLIDTDKSYLTELQIITSHKCLYCLNYDFPFNTSFFISFTVFIDDFNTLYSLNRKFITFDKVNDDKMFSFEELGLTEEAEVRFEYNKYNDKLYYYKDDELFDKILIEGEEAGVILKEACTSLKTVALGCKDIEYNIDAETDSIIFNNVKIESIDDLDDDDLIDRVISDLDDLDYSIMCVETNEWETLRVNFRYHERDRVILFIFGEPLNYFPNDVNSKFLQPSVVEIEDENYDSDYITYLDVPVINDEIDDAYGLVLSSNSSPLLFYDFVNDDSSFDENSAINGVQIQIEGEINSSCILSAGLFIKNRQYVQSVVFNDNVNESGVLFDKGGYNDTWGVNRRDINSFKDIGVILKYEQLNEDEESNILINNIILTVYYEQILDTSVFCKIGDEYDTMIDTREIGMFIHDIDVPYGLESKIKYYNVLGSDNQMPYSQTINPQELKIKFSVQQGNINDSSECLRQITRLLSTMRDEDNKPIPKLISFSHLPDKIFKYITKKSIDSKLNIDRYTCNVSLEIPSGYGDSIEDTVTGNAGIVKSIVPVHPNLKISNLVYDSDKKSTHITITEKRTEQELVIDDLYLENTRKFNNQDYLSLNCAEKELKLYKYDVVNDEYSAGVDVTDAVTKISEWFILDDVFDFEATNARIIHVSYNEK